MYDELADKISAGEIDPPLRIKRYSKYRFKIWWETGSSETRTRRCTPEVRAEHDAGLLRLAAASDMTIET